MVSGNGQIDRDSRRTPLIAGLIGRGMAGTVFHAPLLRSTEGVELAAIAGSDDAPALIADPAIDFVVIATPNTSHAELAEAALRAGKHVVIDKPFALSGEEADQLIALAAERGRVLTVFHNRRWDGDFLTVRALVESNRLGEILLYQACWDRFRPAIKRGWRESSARGSGVLWDLGPHLIDQALVLFGLPTAITADIATQRADAQAVDYFHLTLHYGRLRVLLSASTMVADPRPRFEIHGSAGSFRKYGLDPQEDALRGGASPLDRDFGAEPEGLYGRSVDSAGAAQTVRTSDGRYLEFYRQVVAAIGDDGPPPVAPADARNVIAIIERAIESARAGTRLSLG